MQKRVTMVGILVGVLLTTATPQADAHYLVVSGGLFWHTIDCEAKVRDLALDVDFAVKGVCTIVGTLIEAQCANPAGQVQTGAAFQHVFGPGEGTLVPDEQSIDKKGKSTKGKGGGRLSVTVISDEDAPTLGLQWNEAGCPNANWTVHRALLRSALVYIDFYREADEEHLSTAVLNCSLDSNLNLNDPTLFPLPENAWGCTVIRNLDCHPNHPENPECPQQ